LKEFRDSWINVIKNNIPTAINITSHVKSEAEPVG
jgi:hypothetical protein